ncbi:hypothetical protein E3J95_00745 [Candidatus Aerophobetes bacterium]|uniref:Uncharacterized protein n=1 Tax=Aerophobetes bacterium TaxID=2030807 RepID=A0A523QMD0_UNCAE|nr:MAG: hypothetical protein E3J95_00745 [Candidatus Aerophobetes bacterium]
MTEPQAIDGYGCSCGFVTPTLKEFRKHFCEVARKREKGVHKSIGRINLQTMEVTMPPYLERSPEQKRESEYAVKKESKSGTGKTAGTAVPAVAIKPTEVLADASIIKFVPRVFTCDYSPVMRAAQEASRKLWGWPDMPLGDFLDTVIHMFFKSCRVTLTGYIVEETEEERMERERQVAAKLAVAIKEAVEQPEEVTSGS